jgi:DNA polymerase-3 subunit delta'
LRVAAGAAPFSEWMKYSESIARGRSEKLEFYLKVLYMLLRDLLILRESGGEIRNTDMRKEIEALAPKIDSLWVAAAVKKIDELAELLRRNIQKTIALDALILELRGSR